MLVLYARNLALSPFFRYQNWPPARYGNTVHDHTRFRAYNAHSDN